MFREHVIITATEIRPVSDRLTVPPSESASNVWFRRVALSLSMMFVKQTFVEINTAPLIELYARLVALMRHQRRSITYWRHSCVNGCIMVFRTYDGSRI